MIESTANPLYKREKYTSTTLAHMQVTTLESNGFSLNCLR